MSDNMETPTPPSSPSDPDTASDTFVSDTVETDTDTVETDTVETDTVETDTVETDTDTVETSPAREPGEVGLLRRMLDGRGEAVVGALVVAGSMLFIALTLHPDLVLANTTPTGGDMGAHVWGPAFLRDHLLPHGRLSGWTPDWYAGFPAYQFYMVLPALAIVALDVVLPYGVAFKLVTMSGLVAMPLAAYLFGRLVRLSFPGPVLMSLAATLFLFDRSFTIYGGNIASTMAGEFSFTISLAFALVYLGVIIRGVHTGRHRAIAAVLLAIVVLCHVIPAVFAVVSTLVVLVTHGVRRSFGHLAVTGVVGSALAGFWAIPFLARRGYMTNMGYEKMDHYVERLVPGRIGLTLTEWFGGKHDPDITGDITVVFVLAVMGVVIVLLQRHRFGMFLALSALAFAVAYVVLPHGRLWNPRLLPFWYLNLYLLAALAVSEAVQSVAVLVSDRPNQPSKRALLAGPVLASAIALVVVSLPLRILPGGRTAADGTSYSWLGLKTRDHSFVRGWAEWNYSGYERKEAFPEYRDVVGTMKWIGEHRGCGRAMWEYEDKLNRFGTPMALMLLPYWTDGCIGSMEGLYFESASTTPYHFLNAAELSKAASNPQRGLPYGTLDVDKGVDHLQMLGVRYYMAFSPQAIAEADQNSELTAVTTTGAWHVYEVEDADPVEALGVEPAVMTDVDGAGDEWLDPSVDWYVEADGWKMPLAAGGPSEWQRLERARGWSLLRMDAATDGPAGWQEVESGKAPEINKVRKAKVTDVEVDTDRISFDVDRPGTPVIVKASYFPNWKVSGAEGPWRVTPSLMVVVPTSKHVELSYGLTGVDWFARFVTLVGVAGLIVLARRRVPVSGTTDADPEFGEAPEGSGDPSGDG